MAKKLRVNFPTENPEPRTLNPEPRTLNPEPKTPNPAPPNALRVEVEAPFGDLIQDTAIACKLDFKSTLLFAIIFGLGKLMDVCEAIDRRQKKKSSAGKRKSQNPKSRQAHFARIRKGTVVTGPHLHD